MSIFLALLWWIFPFQVPAPVQHAVSHAATTTTTAPVPVENGPPITDTGTTVPETDWLTTWVDPIYGPGFYEGNEETADAEALGHDGTTPTQVTNEVGDQ